MVLDGAGGEALDLSLELVRDRHRILTLVHHHRAAEPGVLVSKSGLSATRLAEPAALYAKGDLLFTVRRAYSYTEAVAAHRKSKAGTPGKNSSHVSLRYPACSSMWTSGRSRLWSLESRPVTP
ncbi:hypothetical protein [Amycolatopsis sp. lyj-23]|uniref:hypothetical protein n=1 Tax=Amycolatopsis sp. lyj-23 TaxID=2789283 RepID=UPI00397C015A